MCVQKKMIIIFVLSFCCMWSRAADAISHTSYKPPILTTTAIIEVFNDSNDFEGIVLIERGKAPWRKAIPRGKVKYGETVEAAVS